MAQWKGMVGLGFTPDDFDTYVPSVVFNSWRPQFVVLHNTAAPSLSHWHDGARLTADAESRELLLQ
jgi:hypothetical protein